MLDLSKPFGVHDGIVLYGDHEHNNVVYYLPNEVGLQPVEDTPDGEKTFDFFLQIFKEGTAIRGGLEELQDSAGAIMSLGIQCTVDEEKLSRVRGKLIELHGLKEDFFFSPPEWQDGSVDLIVLDTSTQSVPAEDKDTFVQSIIGSKKPSLSGADLGAVFNVRLDRKGASLVAATLNGDRSSLAGVLYDLTFKAIRPAVDLKIEANLDRCQEKVSHLISVGAAVSYGGITLSAKAGFDFIKEKLIEEGDIKVDLLSQVTDPETKKMVDELVKEFTDNVMRELFQPMVNPALNVDIQEGLGKAGPEIGVAYKFKKEQFFHNKSIVVDYRQRSATLKTHNPQAHLWLIGLQIKDQLDLYTKTVTFSDLWRENAIEAKVLHDFDEEGDDLLSAEVLIWRKKDGKKQATAAGGFDIPEDAQPLAGFTVTADDQESHKIAWITESDEPAGYFYQVKFLYKDIPNISSPTEIFSEIIFSSSQDLVIIPQVLSPLRIYKFLYGSMDPSKISEVDIFIRALDGDGEQLEQKLLNLTSTQSQEVWKYRARPTGKVMIEEERHFHFADGRPTLKIPPVALIDEEIIVSDPFAFMGVAIIPVITGALPEKFSELLLRLTYSSESHDFDFDQLLRAKAPSFVLEEITIPVLEKTDGIQYKFTGITTDGELIELEEGTAHSGPLILKITSESDNHRITIRWEGPSPESEDLDYLRLEFKLIRGDQTEEELPFMEFSGSTIPAPKEYVYSSGGDLYMRQIKRFFSGDKEKEKFRKISGNELVVGGEM